MKKITTLIFMIIFLFNYNLFSQKFLEQLNTEDDYKKLEGRPLLNKYGNVKAVKLVYDLNLKKLFFINADLYKDHYDFCKNELNYTDGNGNFLKHNYSKSKERKYLLANLNFFQALNKYVIEISPTDNMNVEQLNLICKTTQRKIFADSLYFFVNNPKFNSKTTLLDRKIKLITPSQIYGNLIYQPISLYHNTGTIQFLNEIELKYKKIRKDAILVLNKIPNTLPPIAGLIVTEFQTPLSHIAILGRNRKIPICALKNAFNSNVLQKFKNKHVRFHVMSDTINIKLDTTLRIKKNKIKIKLKKDLSIDSLIGVEYLNIRSSGIVGSKAANFAELYHISKKANFKTPECAFAIPFYFYNQHIEKSNVKDLIAKLENVEHNNYELKEEYLKEIRKKIKNTEIDKELLSKVRDRLKKSKDFEKFRFRSSTNAEDMEGFSGAGLYKSRSGKLNSKKKSINKAIKTVWASNWSKKAYYEREYYNIKQSNVAMGILVHRSFPNELVNGVAITKNIYRKNSNGFIVNAQIGNEKVVNPTSGIVCDQFLCFPQTSNKIYQNKTVIDVITYSSLNDNNLIMFKKEIQNLANQLNIIKKHFAGDINKWEYVRVAYDIEFKIDGNDRQLYIKQIRPYNE